MNDVQPPPTWADLTVTSPSTKKTSFNPVWLQYFIQVGARASVNYAAQVPTGAMSSASQTTSPYTFTATSLTTLVLSGTISAITYTRGAGVMTLGAVSMVDVQAGDSVTITFTGTLTVGQIPR